MVPDMVAGLKYDADSNITYVALLAGAGPSVLTRALNVEINPPSYPDITVAADDVDAGSFDLGGVPITNRYVTCPDDTVAGDDYVTLSSVGPHTVTLTIVNSNGVSASDTCTVTLSLPSAGVTNSLTWDGGATLSTVARKEWVWDNNWVGDIAPSNPTTGVLTFSTVGVGTNVLEASRTIGGLEVRNQTGLHYFDLSSNALSIAGDIVVNPGAGNTTSSLLLTNGTVKIGTPAAKRNVTLGSGSTFYFTGQMTVAPGVCLEANLAALTIGYGWSGRGFLDLRGVNVSNRVFEATDILMGVNGQGSTYLRPCELRIDETTALDELRVGRYLDVSVGEHNTCRIGNPTNNWCFPTNLNLTVGSVGQRGRIRIGEGYWSADGVLISATGGTFTAWLTDLHLGLATPSKENSYGTMNFKSMSNCAIDVSGSIDVGYTAAGSSDEGKAYTSLALPRGTVLTKDLKVGVPIGGSRLELYGTVCTVTNSAVVGPYGTVSNFLYGTSAGLDLASTANLSVSNGGKIVLVFQTKGSTTGLGYWGLRWAGDHQSELQTLKDAGKITYASPVIGGAPDVYRAGGCTYVGYQTRGVVFMMR